MTRIDADPRIGSAEWYVKSCRVDGFRAWFRELFRGPKARLEFQHARELARLGIAAVEPIAWSGRRWPSPSQIVTKAVPDAIPLDEYLERRQSLRSAERKQIALALAGFFAQLYRSGVLHPDPHPGNLLVSFDERGAPKLTLLDVHAVTFHRSLSKARIVGNLVLLNRWFAMRSTRTDRLRFWVELLKQFPIAARDDAGEIERLTLASNLRFWSRRFDRYVGTNREFKPVRSGRCKGFVVRDWPGEAFQPLLENPDRGIERVEARVLKQSPSSRVVAMTLRMGDRDVPVIFKRIPLRSRWSGLKNLLRASSVRRSWSNAHSLRDRGIPSPRPLIVFHRYRFGLPCEGYLLAEECPNAIPLAEAVSRLAEFPASERERILESWIATIARQLRLMHDRGMAHGDCKAANLLLSRVSADPAMWKPFWIDLVGAESALVVTANKRHRDLSRLAISFLGSRLIAHRHRVNFLKSYRSIVPRQSSDWKAEWHAIAGVLRAKVAQNQRRNRPLG